VYLKLTNLTVYKVLFLAFKSSNIRLQLMPHFVPYYALFQTNTSCNSLLGVNKTSRQTMVYIKHPFPFHFGIYSSTFRDPHTARATTNNFSAVSTNPVAGTGTFDLHDRNFTTRWIVSFFIVFFWC